MFCSRSLNSKSKANTNFARMRRINYFGLHSNGKLTSGPNENMSKAFVVMLVCPSGFRHIALPTACGLKRTPLLPSLQAISKFPNATSVTTFLPSSSHIQSIKVSSGLISACDQSPKCQCEHTRMNPIFCMKHMNCAADDLNYFQPLLRRKDRIMLEQTSRVD
jgi:hypothetical protein